MSEANDLLDVILYTVEGVYGVKIPNQKKLRGSTSQQNARKMYCYVASCFTAETLDRIGSKINRDHACIINAKNKAEDHLNWEKSFNVMLNKCLEILPNEIESYKEKTILELKAAREDLIENTRKKIKELEKIQSL